MGKGSTNFPENKGNCILLELKFKEIRVYVKGKYFTQLPTTFVIYHGTITITFNDLYPKNTQNLIDNLLDWFFLSEKYYFIISLSEKS